MPTFLIEALRKAAYLTPDAAYPEDDEPVVRTSLPFPNDVDGPENPDQAVELEPEDIMMV